MLHLIGMTLNKEQCEGANIFPMLLFLVFHGLKLVLCRTSLSKRLCLLALIATGVYITTVRGVVFLTIMHQIMGMMAAEAAVRVLRCPLVLAAGWADGLSLFCLFVPNLLIVLGETWFAIRVSPWLHVAFFHLDHFGKVPFYQKQHAVLHAVLCVLILSVSTSLHPRWRRSTRMQLARVLVEPASLVSVASILFTHHHGTHNPDLASHPLIGTLMCLSALMQVLAYLAHIAAPTADGAMPDVTQPLKKGEPPIVRVSRALQAYAYLLLAYFLYVDTFMEYLGCRQALLKVGPAPDPSLESEADAAQWAGLGLNADSELSTYVSLGVMGAALALSCILVFGPSEAEDADPQADQPPYLVELLPPASPSASPRDHGEDAESEAADCAKGLRAV